MAITSARISANYQTKGTKTNFVRLSDVGPSSTTDYAEILCGDGAPSGGYGRDASASMLYIRKDATDNQAAFYGTRNGGTTWAPLMLDPALHATVTAAAGSTTSDATVLPTGGGIYKVTGADGTKGVRIHATDEVAGREITIWNAGGATLKIYPPTGGSINGNSADAASAGTKSFILRCMDAATHLWLLI